MPAGFALAEDALGISPNRFIIGHDEKPMVVFDHFRQGLHRIGYIIFIFILPQVIEKSLCVVPILHHLLQDSDADVIGFLVGNGFGTSVVQSYLEGEMIDQFSEETVERAHRHSV